MEESAYLSIPPRTADGRVGFSFTRLRATAPGDGAAVRFLPPAGARLRFVSRAADTLEMPGLPHGFLQAGDEVMAWYNGAVVFRGSVSKWTERLGRGGEHLDDVVAKGPWDLLERLVYTQSWTVTGGTTNTSRVVLNQASNGGAASVAATLRGIAEYAAGRSGGVFGAAPASADDATLAAVTLPFDETRDVTCAQAVARVLRFFPETVSKFDYSNSYAAQKLRFFRPDLSTDAAWTAAVPATAVAKSYDAHPCVGVDIEVETTGAINDSTYTSVIHQTAGNTSSPDCLRAYLPLAGTETRTTYQKLETVTEALPQDLNDASWWKSKHPRLANILQADIAISQASRSGAADAANYPRISSNGARELDEAGLHARVETFTCRASVKYRATEAAGGDIVDEEQNILLSMQFVTTNAAAGTHTYKWRTSRERTSGETLPSGLAAAILAQRGGSLSSATLSVRLGQSLPSVGDAYCGLALQQVDVDCASLTAECAFGRPEYIEAGDMRSLLSGFRSRVTTRHDRRRTGASSGDDPVVDAGGVMPLSATEFAPGAKARAGVRRTVSGTAHSVSLDPSDIAFAAASDKAAQAVKLREVRVVVEEDGAPVTKLAQVLCGEPYGTPGTVGGGGGGAPASPSSATTVGSTAEGSESADSASWTAGSSAGLKLYVLTRVAYNESGDKALYGFKRLLTFDSQGRLYSVGGESRFTIDQTVEVTLGA